MARKLTNEEFKERLYKYTNNSIELISQYINKRTKVLVKCKVCGYIWELSPTCLYGNYHFNGCPECKYIEFKCDYCGKNVKRLKSEVRDNKTGFHYCSRECGNKHKNEPYINKIDSTAYRRNAFDFYKHECELCG